VVEVVSGGEGPELIFKLPSFNCRFSNHSTEVEGPIGNWQSAIETRYVENHSLDGRAWCGKRYAGALAS